MPAQHSRTRRGRVNSPAVATPRAQRGGRRGEPTPPPSPSPPRQEASSRHDPAVAAYMHAPEVQGSYSHARYVPTHEALEAFRVSLGYQGRRPTYREYQDFLDYWRIFGRQAQTTPVTTPQTLAPPRAPSGRSELVREGKRVRENIAKRRSLEAGQPSKKSRSEGSSKGNSTPGPTRPPLSQSGDQQRLTRSDSAPSVRGPEASNRCKNCGKPHKGQCQTPRKCFHCGQTGHLRSACPELGRGGSTPASQDRPSQFRGSQPVASSPVTTKSGAASNTSQPGAHRPQTRAQTRVFAMTEEEAECRPNVITGGEASSKGKEIIDK
ncbi:uncharacterized protein LOC120253542 [Dioscorea cayenensis subsp. rotundata]|uniref:Uncharacterized protein LOC120253542 n=1 Tax=Dioscorea cayennensis subsp. rotundata TaxID=55577 RepID=A0AB40AT68_DIOCR|nr:uncharacterized protein LOC120253542 [Dioscorea cayenensis subsp. rotundata]